MTGFVNKGVVCSGCAQVQAEEVGVNLLTSMASPAWIWAFCSSMIALGCQLTLTLSELLFQNSFSVVLEAFELSGIQLGTSPDRALNLQQTLTEDIGKFLSGHPKACNASRVYLPTYMT